MYCTRMSSEVRTCARWPGADMLRRLIEAQFEAGNAFAVGIGDADDLRRRAAFGIDTFAVGSNSSPGRPRCITRSCSSGVNCRATST